MSKVTREELIYMIKNDIDYSNVDVSGITDMSRLFMGNEVKYDITKWDVSNVTDMRAMFFNCKTFNQDISKWNTSNVTDMSYMFNKCKTFNQDISKWNTASVTDMSHMFMGNEVKYDITKWDVSNVTDMSGMFFSCKTFNQDISNWDVSKVTNMSFMFYKCETFNQDISSWNTSKVTDMSYMFNEVPAYEVYTNCGKYNISIYKYPNKDIWFCGCRVSTKEELIEAIIEKYGSLEAYGITDGILVEKEKIVNRKLNMISFWTNIQEIGIYDGMTVIYGEYKHTRNLGLHWATMPNSRGVLAPIVVATEIRNHILNGLLLDAVQKQKNTEEVNKILTAINYFKTEK